MISGWWRKITSRRISSPQNNHPQLSPGVYELTNGICALIGALLIFKITGSFWGWLVLFVPGTCFTISGLVKVIKDWYQDP
jgi:hypothetical protein